MCASEVVFLNAGGTEQGQKRVNNVANVVGQLSQRWEQSISPTNRRLNERFAASEIHVLLLVRELVEPEVGKIWVVGFERNPVHDEVAPDSENQAVLVGNIEFKEQPERRIPVLVWFEPIDCLNRFPARTLYVSRLSGFISLRVVCNRKLDLVLPFGSGYAGFNSNANQVVSEMIQSAHQVVDSIASDCGNRGIVEVERSRFKDWLSGIQVVVKADSVCYRIAERKDSVFQVIDMLVGPFDFYADQVQSVVGRKHDGFSLNCAMDVVDCAMITP